MDEDSETERVIGSTFGGKAGQARLLDFIAKPGVRVKLRRELLDLRRMNPRLVAEVPLGSQTSAGIRGLLARSQAPEDCYLISENADWDGARMALNEALDLVVGAGWSTLVSCRPDRLLYYEGERRSRAILSVAR